uniref:Coiled-coil domain containing 196 n=1 Tax=Rousettus aegyptiacus TaxID=9407 RepID=A0A7J8IGP8_ROUAE|nr:coiled-coil domain containing 196 [Rousettus aegyptiacus]
MASSSDSPGSYVPSKTSSKIDDNYLKELNEDLKLRKQELLEMLKPIADKNNLLFQKLMSNLEEKQRSLQIMRQIMAGKGSEEPSVMELIKEAEEMKQNLERKNKMLRKEMEMLWNKVCLQGSLESTVLQTTMQRTSLSSGLQSYFLKSLLPLTPHSNPFFAKQPK